MQKGERIAKKKLTIELRRKKAQMEWAENETVGITVGSV